MSVLGREPAQDRRQDPAGEVVLDIDRAVEPGDGVEPRWLPSPPDAGSRNAVTATVWRGVTPSASPVTE